MANQAVDLVDAEGIIDYSEKHVEYTIMNYFNRFFPLKGFIK